MDKVRFGIIGLGNQGTHYFKNLFCNGKIKNGYVSALCDINEDKLKEISKVILKLS